MKKQVGLGIFFVLIAVNTAFAQSKGGSLGAREYTMIDSLLYVGSGQGILVQYNPSFLESYFNSDYYFQWLVSTFLTDGVVRSVSDSLNGFVYYAGDNGFVAKVEVSGKIKVTEDLRKIPDFEYSIVQFPYSVDLTDIEILDGRILVVGKNGFAAYSDDEGETWLTSTTGVTSTLTNIELSFGRLFVTGNVGAILISYDNGASWTKTDVLTDRDVNDVSMLGNSLVGFATTDEGLLLKTENGGLLWEVSNYNTEVDITAIDFLDENIGVFGTALNGEFSYLYKTYDGGQSWVHGGLYNEPFQNLKMVSEFQIEFSSSSNVDLLDQTSGAEDLIDEAMADAFGMLHNRYNIALLVTADWVTASWGNFGMRDLGTEPRIEFPNYTNWSYYLGFEDVWNAAYTALAKAKIAEKYILDGGLEPEEENLLGLSYFVQGLVYAQLSLKYDQAELYQSDAPINAKLMGDVTSPRNYIPSNVQTKKRNLTPGFSEKEEQYIPSIIFENSGSKMETNSIGSLFFEYDVVAQVAIEKLTQAASYISEPTNDTFLPLQEDLSNEEFKQLINSTIAELLVMKSRTFEDNEAVDWQKVLELTENDLERDVYPVADDVDWTSDMVIYSIYPAWGRVDQKIVAMMDTTQPSSYPLDGSILPPATSPDARFDSNFEYDQVVNFRPDRGLYFFSHYRFSKYDEYLNTWTEPLPFMHKTSGDLLRAEALIHTGGSKTEAAELINLSRVNVGDLEALTGSETKEELLEAIYYEWTIEVGPFGNGPIAWFNNRRFGELQDGTITQLPVPARILKNSGMEVYTFGGVETSYEDTTLSIIMDKTNQTSITPLITWNSYSSANTYTLSISREDDELVKTALTDTTYQLNSTEKLNYLTTYGAIVSALDSDGNILFTSPQTIFTTVDTLMNAPRLVNPIDETDNVPTRVTFFWEEDFGNSINNSSEDAQYFQLSTNDLFETVLIDTVIGNGNFSNSDRSHIFVVANLDSDVEYFWRVASINEGGISDWSEVFSFQTISPISDGILAPLAPLSGTENVTTPVQFKWQAAANAISYDVQISATVDFTKSIFFQGIGGTTIVVDEVAADRTYFWKVRANTTEGAGEWTTIQQFSTIAPIPDIPVWNPENGGVVQGSSIAFSWGESAFATSYNLQISEDNTFSAVVYEETDIHGNSLDVYNFSSGAYYWRVSASNSTGTSAWSDPLSFQIFTTSSELDDSSIPQSFELNQNYPNPFNPSTRIKFGVPVTSNVELTVYNLLGQEVAKLVDGNMAAGYHIVNFDANMLTSGVYVYILKSGNYTESKKLTLIK